MTVQSMNHWKHNTNNHQTTLNPIEVIDRQYKNKRETSVRFNRTVIIYERMLTTEKLRILKRMKRMKKDVSQKYPHPTMIRINWQEHSNIDNEIQTSNVLGQFKGSI